MANKMKHKYKYMANKMKYKYKKPFCRGYVLLFLSRVISQYSSIRNLCFSSNGLLTTLEHSSAFKPICLQLYSLCLLNLPFSCQIVSALSNLWFIPSSEELDLTPAQCLYPAGFQCVHLQARLPFQIVNSSRIVAGFTYLCFFRAWI